MSSQISLRDNAAWAQNLGPREKVAEVMTEWLNSIEDDATEAHH